MNFILIMQFAIVIKWTITKKALFSL